MRDWEQTSSPVAHWLDELNEDNYRQRLKSDFLLEDDDPELVDFFLTNIAFGLPMSEAIRVCRQRFEMDFSLLEIRLDKHEAMKIVKDVKVTFPGQLAAIGNGIMISRYVIY